MNNELHLGFTGTQIGTNYDQKIQLNNILLFLKNKEYKGFNIIFHHGDCIGSDDVFDNLVKRIKFQHDKVVIHPPIKSEKRAFCKGDSILKQKEYLNRNHDIIDACDLLIATPKQSREVLRSGTWATIRYARKMHKTITIFIIFPDGKIRLEKENWERKRRERILNIY